MKNIYKTQKKGLIGRLLKHRVLENTKTEEKWGGGNITGAFFCCVSDFTKAGYSF